MNNFNLFDENKTPLQKRRVCPIREKYQQCLHLYSSFNLKNTFLQAAASIPAELDNIEKKLGYHDMHSLREAFHRIELDALNESNRKNGDPTPNQELTTLINSFTDEQWVYFDSNFNTCFLDQLDTKDTPKNYFEHFYGDYRNDFIPAKMQEAGEIYDITFIDERGFLYWLYTKGREYYDSLPVVERSRLYGDIALMGNWCVFDKIGPYVPTTMD